MSGSFLEPIFKALRKELNGEKMDIGDEFVFTCNNATVVVRMDKNDKGEKDLNINIIGGNPIYVDVTLDIFN